MSKRWPARRLVLAVASTLALAALIAFLWADGQTDGGLYCSTAYPETEGDATCAVQSTAVPVFFTAMLIVVFSLVAELFTPRAAKTP